MSKEFTIIERGTELPIDFADGAIVDRDKYVIEMEMGPDIWWDEHKVSTISLEIVGAIVIGSDAYKRVRFRKRTAMDEKFNIGNTIAGKIIASKCMG